MATLLAVLIVLLSAEIHAYPVGDAAGINTEIDRKDNIDERGDLFEGDILSPTGGKSGIIGDTYRWPNRTVVYEISADFDETERMVSRTNVNVERNGNGCFSAVGRRAGRAQTLNLSPPCVRHGIVIHEFIHAIGFFHEQSRTDRDDYVIINWSNIKPGYGYNFQKYSADQVTPFNVSYDYGSIMHYSAYAFAVNQSIPTIIPKMEGAVIGQRSGLSAKDALKINQSRLERGRDATPYAFPMIVAVGRKGDNRYPRCAGTVLNQRWVMTSILCVGDCTECIGDYYFVAGEHNVSQKEGHEQTVHGVKLVTHPLYSGYGVYPRNDIALVKIHPPFRLNRYVSPTNLPSCDMPIDVENQDVTILGWGGYSIGLGDIAFPDVLQETRASLPPPGACQLQHWYSIIPETEICLLAGRGGYACPGDPGGPVLQYDHRRKVHIQIGIIATVFCLNDPTIVTKLTNYLSWIQSVIMETCETTQYYICNDRRDCPNPDIVCCDIIPGGVLVEDALYSGVCRNETEAVACVRDREN